MAFWSSKKEPEKKQVGTITDRMAKAHRAAKLIGEAWEGGIDSFDKAFKDDASGTFCKMIDRVALKHGKGWVPSCFKVYWVRLSEEDRDELALALCETVLEREEQLRRFGVDTDTD
jgi:hypothetical protein